MAPVADLSVTPPVGAEADLWEGHPRHRVVFTIPEVVLNRTGDALLSPVVTAQGIQWPDGSLDVNGVIEPPTVSVESAGDPGLTIGQARELAAAILAAVDIIEGWVSR